MDGLPAIYREVQNSSEKRRLRLVDSQTLKETMNWIPSKGWQAARGETIHSNLEVNQTDISMVKEKAQFPDKTKSAYLSITWNLERRAK